MKADRIKHSGIVECVDGGKVRVRIVQTSACQSCKVASHCNASEKKVKTIDVIGVPDAWRWRSGDAVTVSASTSVAFRALLFSFGVPFVVMVAVLVAVVLAVGDETVGGLCAIASLLPYYAVLYLVRDRIGRSVVFTIDGDKTDNN